MRKVLVECDNCKISRLWLADSGKRRERKILREQSWIVDGENHFCRRECQQQFSEDKKFETERKNKK